VQQGGLEKGDPGEGVAAAGCMQLLFRCPFSPASCLLFALFSLSFPFRCLLFTPHVDDLARFAVKSRIFQVIYVGETVATNISGHAGR